MQQNKEITRFSINSQQNNKHCYKVTYRCSLPLPDITKTVLKVDLTLVCFIASKRQSALIRRLSPNKIETIRRCFNEIIGKDGAP